MKIKAYTTFNDMLQQLYNQDCRLKLDDDYSIEYDEASKNYSLILTQAGINKVQTNEYYNHFYDIYQQHPNIIDNDNLDFDAIMQVDALIYDLEKTELFQTVLNYFSHKLNHYTTNNLKKDIRDIFLAPVQRPRPEIQQHTRHMLFTHVFLGQKTHAPILEGCHDFYRLLSLSTAKILKINFLANYRDTCFAIKCKAKSNSHYKICDAISNVSPSFLLLLIASICIYYNKFASAIILHNRVRHHFKINNVDLSMLFILENDLSIATVYPRLDTDYFLL